MSDTTYVDYVAPAVNAEWLNEINDHVWHDSSVVGMTVHAANKIKVTPFDDISATDVQAALNEINNKLPPIDPLDASEISYTPNGIGAVTTNIQSKLRESVSVKDFGAVGDGIADDYSQIMAALAAIPDGGRLEMNGTFATSAKIIIDPYRVQIVGNPTFVPHGSYSDYLVELGNTGGNDPLVSDLAVKLNVQKLTVDGQLKSRGILMTQVYNSALLDISVFRAFGTSVRMRGCMENSIYGLLISGGKQRQASWVGTQTAWNSGTAYSVGNTVYAPYPTYSGGTTYAPGDFVNHGGEAFRAKQITLGNTPSVTSAFWEWMPFEYFECLIANTNKNPHSSSPLYTTCSTTEANRYWRQVFPFEAALDLDYSDHPYSNNNISFYGMWIRHCDNTPLVRIDSNYSSLSVTDINFFGGQVHQILPEYITAYDALYPSAPCGQVVPSRGLLLEVGRVTDFNIFGGNWRCAEASYCRAIQLGWRNPGKTLRDIGLIGVSLNGDKNPVSGDGDWQIGISALPSYTGVGFKGAELLFRYTGTNSVNIVDPTTAIRHRTDIGVNYNSGRVVINEGANPSITVGRQGEVGTPNLPLRSSGLSTFDARVRAVGGTALDGTGELDIDTQTLRVLYAALYEAFRVQGVNNGANYILAQGNVAAAPPIIQAQGSDTNVDLLLRAKGTGAVRFGTLTGNADAPITGYITIKDDGGTVRKLAVIS